jgi:hypothetical protein
MFEEDFTPEQKEAFEVVKEGVRKLMEDARKKGVRFTREYLKSQGYDGKQIRQIFKAKKIIMEEREKLGTPKENAEKVLNQYFDDKEKWNDVRRQDRRKLKRILKRGIVDVSGNIKPELMKFGKPGKSTVINHDLIAGATTHGVAQYEQWADKIFGKAEFGKDITRDEELILESIAQSRRVIAIDDYKEGQKHPGRLTGNHHRDYISYENLKHAIEKDKRINLELTQDLYDELVQRADRYFDAFNSQLKQLHANHLINEESYDALILTGDYQPREFIQHIDPETTYSFGGKPITVRSSGIKRLVGGSFEALNSDSRKLLLQTIISVQNRIAKNNANIALWDLADQVPDNGIVEKAVIVGKYPSGAPKYEKPPAGYEQIDVMIEGQKRRMNMKDEWAREWIMRDPSIDSQLANIIGWISGARLLRPMATGMFAPEFMITNLARDAGHLWLVTDAFSKHLPIFLKDYQKAFRAVVKDARKKKGFWYDNYIKYGGGMNFLTHQGQWGIDPTSSAMRYELGKTIKALEKYGSYLGETSEIVNRLVLMKQYADKLGLDKHEEGSPEWIAIMKEAVWQARNYIDFSQGGSWTKAIDVAIPYLNAGIQGTRGLVRSYKRDRGEFIWKVGWLMTLAMGLYLANRAINKEAMDNISDSDHARYWIITTPISFMDAKGNKRYVYFAIAKDQGQRFFAQVAEQSMRGITGDGVVWDQLEAGFKDMFPINPDDLMPPSFDAWFGYRQNRNFWLNKDVWQNKYYEHGLIEPREEFTRYTHPALVKWGQFTGMSPERTGYALEQFFTYGNVFTSLVGGGTRAIMNQLPGNEGERAFGELLKEMPFIRKFVRVTNVQTDKQRREQNEALKSLYTRRFRQQKKIRDLSEDYYAKKKQDMPEAEMAKKRLDEYIASQPKEDRLRLKKLHKDYPKYDDIPDRAWWLSLRPMPPEAKAYLYYSKWIRSSEAKRKQMDKLRVKMPGMSADSDAFMAELRKLHKQSEENEE